MTFLPELKRLMDAATKGPWEWDGNKLWHFGSSCRKDDVDPYRYTGINYERRLDKSPTLHANKDLIAYLVKHAPAIAELVEAAEKANEMHIAELWELEEAIAKLNGGKNEG